MPLPLFRIIMLVVMGFILWRTVVLMRRKTQTTPAMIVWLVLWCSMVIFILVPEVANSIALVVGIGRGVDVMVYSAIVALFYAVFRLTLRIEQIDHHLTDIVRQNALHQWREPRHDNSTTSSETQNGSAHRDA